MSKQRRWTAYALSLGMMIALLLEPTLSMEYIRRGMSVCVRTMIPSLFPFMVVSELIVRSGAGEALARLPARLLSRRLGLPAQGICACMLGWLCGFPVGSRTAAAYWRAGRLTDRQFNVVLALCNVPSSAFLVCAVGLSLFGSREVGRGLVALSFLSALTAALVVALLLGKDKTAVPSAGGEREPLEEEGEIGVAHMLPKAISSAASSMLGVCATVLLFFALMGAMMGALTFFSVSDTVEALLLGFFEMSGGVCAASALPDTTTALVACAAMIGWGGLSVHCQIFSVCRGCPLHLPGFWLGRVCQAVICGGGMWLWLRAFPLPLPPAPPSPTWRDLLAGVAVGRSGFSTAWTAVWLLVLFIGCVVGLIKRKERKHE